MIDRCPDCGLPLSTHFRHEHGRKGEFTGCPTRLLASALSTDASATPRVVLRVYTYAARKGHLIIVWADCVDDRQALVTDLDAGDQWIDTLDRIKSSSRGLKGEESERARDKVETALGHSVRVVKRV